MPLYGIDCLHAPLRHEDKIIEEGEDLWRRLKQAGDDGGAEGSPVPPEVVHQAVQRRAVQARADLVQEEGAPPAQEHLRDGDPLALTAADAPVGEGMQESEAGVWAFRGFVLLLGSYIEPLTKPT